MKNLSLLVICLSLTMSSIVRADDVDDVLDKWEVIQKEIESTFEQTPGIITVDIFPWEVEKECRHYARFGDWALESNLRDVPKDVFLRPIDKSNKRYALIVDAAYTYTPFRKDIEYDMMQREDFIVKVFNVCVKNLYKN